MSIHRIRGFLYKLAKLLGDITALSSGRPDKITKRAARRITGKQTGKLFRKIFK